MRYRRGNNERHPGNVKAQQPDQEGLVVPEQRVREVGPHKGRRVGDHGAGGHKGGRPDGGKARVPVPVVRAGQKEGLREVDPVKGESFEEFDQEYENDGVLHGFEAVKVFVSAVVDVPKGAFRSVLASVVIVAVSSQAFRGEGGQLALVRNIRGKIVVR